MGSHAARFIEPHVRDAALPGMSNNTFLAVVGTIIVLLVGRLAIQKYEACIALGDKACPMTRGYFHPTER